MPHPFHLALHVDDLAAARAFYGGVLGCPEGRSAETWVDFDFFGHQVSLHRGTPVATTLTGQVDGKAVPMPHLGVVLPMEDWQALADRLTEAGIAFALPPQRRFAGEAGEQATLFLHDPAGNALEFKGFATAKGMFAG